MSVIGIGTDIIDIERIESMAEKAKLRLAQRILTDDEMNTYQLNKQPNRYLAKRWSAKEATAKALGTGIADGVSFQHIKISSKSTGQPMLHLSDRALEIATKLGATTWFISISDEAKYATAFVVLSN